MYYYDAYISDEDVFDAYVGEHSNFLFFERLTEEDANTLKRICLESDINIHLKPYFSYEDKGD